ncbi:hypothetical protein AVDCRST_MAG84-4027 [uncultured Microcoleus sp.]|uniref:Uncharacterized protein n=1 Tax=uncultured Microcoleus sp. TaxID=259945 RepID=A0A6J4MTD7_9CYAN|nr:hypothetical protein AVDCRST_MAG84-4027 [uncultured Microcoleus sp.]
MWFITVAKLQTFLYKATPTSNFRECQPGFLAKLLRLRLFKFSRIPSPTKGWDCQLPQTSFLWEQASSGTSKL